MFISEKFMPTWQRSVEGRVCAWTGYSALLSNLYELWGSCFLPVICLNSVTAVRTWGRLIMLADMVPESAPVRSPTNCLSNTSRRQALWSWHSVDYRCVQWEVFATFNILVVVTPTGCLGLSVARVGADSFGNACNVISVLLFDGLQSFCLQFRLLFTVRSVSHIH